MAKGKKKEETTDFGDIVMTAAAGAPQFEGSSFDEGYGLKFYQARGKDVPFYATEFSAGFDLRADLEVGDVVKKYDSRNQYHEVTARAQDNGPARVYLEPGDRALIPTGLFADIPEGYWIAIHPRSGTSWKQGIGLTNSVAVIDADYVNEIFISVINLSGSRIAIEDGDRIAQGLLMLSVITDIRRLDKKPEQKTSRAGGFGSTGSK